MSNGAPWWVAASYLLYVILFDGLIFGITAWAVFACGHSGWWFLVAVLVGSCAYQPAAWRELWMPSPTDIKNSTKVAPSNT